MTETGAEGDRRVGEASAAHEAPPPAQAEAAGVAADGAAAGSEAARLAATAAGAVAASGARPRGRKLPWWWILLGLMVVEFWMYGRRGYVEVCVGKQGETDFSLTTAPRTDDNRWKFPRCEQRTNLGLLSKYDDVTAEALSVACRGATIFRNQGQGKQCIAGEAGWERRIETRHCPPWHAPFYEHLFWFLK